MIERAVTQCQDQFNALNLANSLQSAYRVNHPTETALLTFNYSIKTENYIHIQLSHGNVTLLVLLGLSAALDTIDHALLIKMD